MTSTNLISKAAVILALSLAGTMASAETVCRDLWSVHAVKAKQFLLVVLTEKEQQGPACDLIVESAQYDEKDRSVALKVRPATFCPLEALKSRSAQWMWALPFDLRDTADLRLIVNDRETGSLNMERTSVTFEGGCK